MCVTPQFLGLGGSREWPKRLSLLSVIGDRRRQGVKIFFFFEKSFDEFGLSTSQIENLNKSTLLVHLFFLYKLEK